MLTDDEIRKMAAESCQKEIDRLKGVLEELVGHPKKRLGRPPASAASAPHTSAPPEKKRRKMSAAARKRISDRMKKRWADLRSKK